MQPIRVSSDCTLTPLASEDAHELFGVTEANRDYLRGWLPWLDSIKRVEDTAAFIRAARAQSAHNNGTQLAIKESGRIVGVVGHHQIDWRNRLTSLGYWVAQEHQGHGVVTTACRAVVTHAFTHAGLNRVEIRCAVGNHKSRAIPQRLDFVQEGLIRDAEWLYDHFVDHIVYAMLAREWTTDRQSPPMTAVGLKRDRSTT